MVRKRFYLLIFLTFFIFLGVIALFLWASPSKNKQPTLPHTALELSSGFNLVRERLSSDGNLHSNLKVDEQDSHGKLGRASSVIAHAWSILGHASLYKQTNELQYIQKIKEDLERWKAQSNGLEEIGGLFQLYRASVLTQIDSELSKSLTTWYWGRMKFQVEQYQRSKKTGQLSLGEPIYLATMAQQFMFAYSILNDTTLYNILLEHHQFGSIAEMQAYQKKLYDYSLDVSSILYNRIYQDAVSRPFLIEQKKVPQYACWEVWTRYGMYENVGLKEERDKAIDLLRSFAFHIRQVEDVHPILLQNLMPCVETMVKLDSEHKFEAKEVIEKFFLPVYDSKSQPLCTGSGGFLARISTSEDTGICEGNSVFLSDSAWLTYILSFFEPEESFKRKATSL